jgi:glycosyltransferase involved in cell wall biosynthesis
MKRTPKICLISNPDSIHVRRWARHFSEREFDVSLLSFYQPESEPIPGVDVHYVHPRSPSAVGGGRSRAARSALRFPGLLRLATAARYRRSGFYRLLERIDPDVVHAHYVSDYGYLAALSKRHPLVVSAWGSDILVDPGLSLITRRLVRWVLRQADLVTYDAERVRDVAEGLGASSGRMLRVIFGVDRDLIDALKSRMVAPAKRPPVILSLRSLERTLYNVDVIIEAMPAVLAKVPNARLLIGNDGALRPELEEQARGLGVESAVEFVGMVHGPGTMAELLGRAAVYVSVPSSDGTSVSLLEAMAAGAYPIVSDLPANREWVGAEGGTIVPAGEAAPLADAIAAAVTDPARRESAAKHNQELIAGQALWDANMARMEDAYRGLAGAGVKAGGATR